MKIVYTAGKYSCPHDPWEVEKNVALAAAAAASVVLVGAMPICPHRNTAHFEALQPPDFWADGTIELLRRSDAIYVFDPKWMLSPGTVREIYFAIDNKIPLFFHVVTLGAWISTGTYVEVTREQVERTLPR